MAADATITFDGNSSGYESALSKVQSSLKSFASGATNLLANLGSATLKFAKSFALPETRGALDKFGIEVQNIGDKLSQAISPAFDVIVRSMVVVAQTFNDALGSTKDMRKIGAEFADYMRDAISYVIKAAGKVSQIFYELAQDLTKFFKTILSYIPGVPQEWLTFLDALDKEYGKIAKSSQAIFDNIDKNLDKELSLQLRFRTPSFTASAPTSPFTGPNNIGGIASGNSAAIGGNAESTKILRDMRDLLGRISESNEDMATNGVAGVLGN